VFQILVNLFRSELRRTEARHRNSVTTDGGGASRDAHLELVEVAEAFHRLPTDQQDTLYLVIIEGFTCKEAAEILDIPIGTVLSRLSRGREAMREALRVQIARA
jgi:RNA polymerase sigma-70 factor (ECF subfamily)